MILVELLVLAIWLTNIKALYFHIGETEKKCFIEEIPDETMVVGSYKVQLYDPSTKGYGDYPNIGMHVEVKDPDDKIILSKLYTSEGRFTFTSHSPGEHMICLYSNSTTWFSGAQLRVHLDIQAGEHTQDYEKIAAKDKLNDLQVRIRQLRDQVEQITKEQNYQRFREERFRETSENTNSRVLWWSIIQTTVLVLTGAWQMRHLKGFFEAKNMSKLSQFIKSPFAIGVYIFGVAAGGYHVISKRQKYVAYDNVDLSGKTYIVSGATSGIGQQMAMELAKRSARVIMACRDRRKCVSLRREIVMQTNNRQVYCRQCDLTDFDSVHKFVKKVSKGKFQLDRIDGVLLNAATMESKRNVNKDGIELDLATNCIGQYLLIGLLMNKLLSQPNPVRIVFVTTNSIFNKCGINFDDLNFERRNTWNAFQHYKETKLAETIIAKELSAKLSGTNLNVIAVDPGQTRTNLASKLDAEKFFLSRWILRPLSVIMGYQRVQKAVVPVLYALVDKKLDKKNGIFIDREKKEIDWNDELLNPLLRKRLWLTCAKWSNINEHLKVLEDEMNTTLDAGKVQNREGNRKSAKRFWLF
uniref:GOLD domain-containing protein n=1 Tax=Syphacia muris TaxID=451379 RepID=A0A0N5ATX2_9BILA